MNKMFCPECRCDVTYKIKEQSALRSIKGKEYSFDEKIALCDNCGAELCVDNLEKENLKNLYDVYRKENGIISIDKIREISYRYRIGKRPLSVLLGWGENTYSRFYDGDMPSKQYSDILWKLYDEPDFFIQLIEESKKELQNSSAYEKSFNAAIKFKTKCSTRIESVALYLLNACEDITHLALQKMLYYVQAFYKTFYDGYIFEDDCEAWIHGPVYSEVAKKYSNYNFSEHGNIVVADDFSCDEKSVMDNVVANFGCYSGKILEYFTHSEMPWMETRKGLGDYEIQNRIIDKKLIENYFSSVKVKYNMLQPSDISDYAKDMFAKVSK